MGTNITVAPIVVAPSQYWDGNDGPWSTFNIHVGTPPQPTRVLVSSTLGETWVVSANKTAGGCLEGQDDSSCPLDRGALFNMNASSTWQDQGIFGLGLELNLPDYHSDGYDNGDYGLETLGLGLPGSSESDEAGIVVAGIATKAYYMGYLGVTQHPTNFTQFDDPHTAYLTRLKETNKIPSLSYGYTAGAQYRFRKVLGSLTLGGYDAAKFEPNDVDFRFASDISRDLVVGLQSISYSDPKGTTKSLLPEGILTFIDSTVPQIWLPTEACTLFEDAFGISYNETVDRYLVNSTTHANLQSQNASLKFTVGNEINGGAAVDITFPYAAFDLEIKEPIVNDTQRYFPLRRAANESQYTLGRTFLQEAYLIVNYESSNFSVSQNAWVEDAPSHILAIRDPKAIATPPPEKKSGISTGSIVGIVVAIIAAILVAAGVAFFVIRRNRKRRKEKEAKDTGDDQYRKAEMDGTGKPPVGELFAEGKFGEEVDSSSKIEMQGSHGFYDKNRAEIEGSKPLGVEMEGTKGGVEMEGSRLRAEMDGDHLAPIELDAGSHGLYEMPSPITSTSELPSPGISSNRSQSKSPAGRSNRNKPTPNVPHSDHGGLSPDPGNQGRRTGHSLWSGRWSRGKRESLSPHELPSPTSSNRTRHPSGNTHLEVPSRTNSPMHVPAQRSPVRERQPSHSEEPNRRTENASNRTTPTDLSSSGDEAAERGNRRFDSRERILGTSTPPRPSPSDRRPSNGSREIIDRRPSPLGAIAGRVSPSNRTPNERSPRAESPLPPGNFF